MHKNIAILDFGRKNMVKKHLTLDPKELNAAAMGRCIHCTYHELMADKNLLALHLLLPSSLSPGVKSAMLVPPKK